MTSTLDTAVPHDFPMPRDAKCPFDPPPELRDLQEQTPMTTARLPDGRRAWLVTRYADQRELLTDARLSADVNRDGHPNKPATGVRPLSFITMDDPDHARLRRMVTAPFMVKRIAQMRPAIQKIVDDLIDEMLAGPKPADLVESFALPVPSLVICELLGVPYEDHSLFQRHSKVMIGRSFSTEEKSVAHQALFDYLESLVHAKRSAPQDDLLSELAQRIDAGELTTSDVAQMGVLLLIAGHETTANMIGLGTAALLSNPDQLALLQTEDNATVARSAVEELLRYLHITHNGRRRVALEPIEIAGVTIEPGDGVIMANDIANRDPRVFDNPDELNIERDARGHVAFGFGVHQCLGQSLARLELDVVYSTLYRRIPTLALATPLDDLSFKHDGAVFGVYELPVTW